MFLEAQEPVSIWQTLKVAQSIRQSGLGDGEHASVCVLVSLFSYKATGI